jgi:cleavage and polyadenylation specificity factor subunit 1
LPNLKKPIYSTDALPYLPGIITDEFIPRRNAARETITDVVMAEIGDSTSKSTYLIVCANKHLSSKQKANFHQAQTTVGELVIYQPFHYPVTAGGQFFKNLRWQRISQPVLPKHTETASDEESAIGRTSTLRVLNNIGGYSTVVGTWPSPCFVLKEASTTPKVVRLNGRALSSIGAFHTEKCDQGFISVDFDVRKHY